MNLEDLHLWKKLPEQFYDFFFIIKVNVHPIRFTIDGFLKYVLLVPVEIVKRADPFCFASIV
jgi:hypothetical protein